METIKKPFFFFCFFIACACSKIEIDVKCQELLDICGIDYEISKKDICICKVILNLNKDEFEDELKNLTLRKVNKKDVTERLLVPEIAQYTKSVH